MSHPGAFPIEALAAPASAVRGFPPLARHDARVLVLGTVPSARSLELVQYYAHSRNAFWPIMEALFAGGATLEYTARVRMLQRARVALWDVLRAAERPGSLDASIVPGTEVANDIAGFLAAHREVAAVFFNGAKAQALFARHVAPTLSPSWAGRLRRLPSTSPANAALSAAAKLAAWSEVAVAARSGPPTGAVPGGEP